MAGSSSSQTAPVTAYVFGYGRVSTTQQDLTRQLDALGKDGIPTERVYVDTKSGSSAAARDGLQELLGQVRPGDVIVVHTLDRLGRTIREVLNLIHDLTERGINLRSLADPMPVDTTHDDAMNRMSMLMLAMFVEMERVYANERAAHARAVRRASGKRVGRKKAHVDKDIEYARLLRHDGHSFTAVSSKTGIPVTACTDTSAQTPRTRRLPARVRPRRHRRDPALHRDRRRRHARNHRPLPTATRAGKPTTTSPGLWWHTAEGAGTRKTARPP